MNPPALAAARPEHQLLLNSFEGQMAEIAQEERELILASGFQSGALGSSEPETIGLINSQEFAQIQKDKELLQ